uniref:Uncharacterized protein n=1 Tax=Anguilla anguilla TaxID=7936 RepID=A0A0E9W181_ANGAN
MQNNINPEVKMTSSL